MTQEPSHDDDSTRTFSPHAAEDRVLTTSSPSRPPTSSPYRGQSKPTISSLHDKKNEKPLQQTKSGTKKWGTKVTRKEFIIIVLFILMILVAAVVAFVLLVNKDDNNNSVFASKQDKYEFILKSLANSTATANNSLPSSIGDLDGIDRDEFSFAAKWIIDVDTVAVSEHAVLVRYALATLFYANGGSEWNRAANWMTSADTCEWEGVGCAYSADSPNVQELDFSDNNLVGGLSPALALLQDLKILWLDKNDIAGPMRGDVFAAMPNLAILYLQHNALKGPIPKEFLSTGKLYTLYVQGNQLTGAWPEEFCPICNEDGECNGPFTNFGVDCEANPCPCCDPTKNCF